MAVDRGADLPDEPPASRAVRLLADELAEATAKRYRIDAAAAREMIWSLWAKQNLLWQQAEADANAGRLKRTRGYKQAVEQAKTEIYYHLRRYRQAESSFADGVARLRSLGTSAGDDPAARAARDAIVASHVSTRERLPDLDAFFVALFDAVPDPQSVLDIGCGVQPLLFPFDRPERAAVRYVGLDRDVQAVAAVNAWAAVLGDVRLSARRWSLADGFDGVRGPGASGEFDIALALKFIPVVARQERERLAVLRSVPARRLLVTGAREAMVKRHSIARREERSLRGFADEHGFRVVSTFETPSEIGLFLETVR